MSDHEEYLHIPSLEELQGCIVPRPEIPTVGVTPPATSARPCAPESTHSVLSPRAEAFLRHVMQPHNRHKSLGEIWRDLGIPSGSAQAKILNELMARGFIRIETKGRFRSVHIYDKAYECLGIKPPTGEGVGGTAHRIIVQKLAEMFGKQGIAVRIDQEIGPGRKRVDLVLYGKKHIVGVEVGLSDSRQELRNLRLDLESGVLDQVLLVSTDPELLDRTRRAALTDSYLAARMDRVRFLLFEEESME